MLFQSDACWFTRWSLQIRVPSIATAPCLRDMSSASDAVSSLEFDGTEPLRVMFEASESDVPVVDLAFDVNGQYLKTPLIDYTATNTAGDEPLVIGRSDLLLSGATA